MLFKNKIERVKQFNHLKLFIHDMLSWKPFYKYLYKHIQDQFIYNHKSCVRFYMDANTLRDESFKVELQIYHKVYGIYYNEKYLEDSFMYTKEYIGNKFKKFKDIQFIYGEDEYGLYFEVGYSEGY